MNNTVNYIALFDQLNQFLPMLRRQALQAIEYGDINTGRIHHRITYTYVMGGYQFAFTHVDVEGTARQVYMLGDCKIEEVLNEAQKYIQEAHAKPTLMFPWLRLFRRRKPEPKMQYFAY